MSKDGINKFTPIKPGPDVDYGKMDVPYVNWERPFTNLDHERILALEEKMNTLAGLTETHARLIGDLGRLTLESVESVEQTCEEIKSVILGSDPDTVDENRDTGGCFPNLDPPTTPIDRLAESEAYSNSPEAMLIDETIRTIKRLEGENREVDNIRKEQATELDDFYARLIEARELLEEAISWKVKRKRDGAHWFEMKPNLAKRIKTFLMSTKEREEGNDGT